VSTQAGSGREWIKDKVYFVAYITHRDSALPRSIVESELVGEHVLRAKHPKVRVVWKSTVVLAVCEEYEPLCRMSFAICGQHVGMIAAITHGGVSDFLTPIGFLDIVGPGVSMAQRTYRATKQASADRPDCAHCSYVAYPKALSSCHLDQEFDVTPHEDLAVPAVAKPVPLSTNQSPESEVDQNPNTPPTNGAEGVSASPRHHSARCADVGAACQQPFRPAIAVMLDLRGSTQLAATDPARALAQIRAVRKIADANVPALFGIAVDSHFGTTTTPDDRHHEHLLVSRHIQFEFTGDGFALVVYGANPEAVAEWIHTVALATILARLPARLSAARGLALEGRDWATSPLVRDLDPSADNRRTEATAGNVCLYLCQDLHRVLRGAWTPDDAYPPLGKVRWPEAAILDRTMHSLQAFTRGNVFANPNVERTLRDTTRLGIGHAVAESLVVVGTASLAFYEDSPCIAAVLPALCAVLAASFGYLGGNLFAGFFLHKVASSLHRPELGTGSTREQLFRSGLLLRAWSVGRLSPGLGSAPRRIIGWRGIVTWTLLTCCHDLWLQATQSKRYKKRPDSDKHMPEATPSPKSIPLDFMADLLAVSGSLSYVSCASVVVFVTMGTQLVCDLVVDLVASMGILAQSADPGMLSVVLLHNLWAPVAQSIRATQTDHRLWAAIAAAATGTLFAITMSRRLKQISTMQLFPTGDVVRSLGGQSAKGAQTFRRLNVATWLVASTSLVLWVWASTTPWCALLWPLLPLCYVAYRMVAAGDQTTRDSIAILGFGKPDNRVPTSYVATIQRMTHTRTLLLRAALEYDVADVSAPWVAEPRGVVDTGSFAWLVNDITGRVHGMGGPLATTLGWNIRRMADSVAEFYADGAPTAKRIGLLARHLPSSVVMVVHADGAGPPTMLSGPGLDVIQAVPAIIAIRVIRADGRVIGYLAQTRSLGAPFQVRLRTRSS
jgi:hypothetical protein